MRLALPLLLLASIAATPAVAQERTLTPSIVKVGKWAEGIASDGTSLWVAESGQRSIVQISKSGAIVRRETVGRLPVGMVSLDNRVYTLVQTDKIVWQQPATGPGKRLATLAGCPEAISAGAQALWVLTWPDCSNIDSRLVRIDPATGAQTQTATLGRGGQALVAALGKAWLGHTSGGRLSVIDAQTLAVEQHTIRDADIFALTANRTALFAGGRLEKNTEGGFVVLIDPASGQETKRLEFGAIIQVLVADEETLAAIALDGTIWIASARDLSLRGKITLTTGPYRPSSALIQDGKLVVVAQQYQGENGAVFTLSDWR
jgi:hypothetical protein